MNKILDRNKSERISKLRKIAFIWITAVLCLTLLAGTGAADGWVGGIPLTTVQSDTVSGDLWFDATPAPDWGEEVVTKTFTLPEAAVEEPGRITWARLYVSAYCGHMQNDYPFSIINSWDGDNDGSYEQIWPEPDHAAFRYVLDDEWNSLGNDNTALGGGAHDPYKIINDHENRVTSDYFMWYDVRDLIHNQTINVNVNTSSSLDGRIKLITLVVAYNDPSSTTRTKYWVNQGHDVCSYYVEDNFYEVAVGSTEFATNGLTGIASATLTANYLASNNGYYGFPTSDNNFDPNAKTGHFSNIELDRVPDVQAAYCGLDSWDVTSSVTGSENVTFAYARYLPATGISAFYKIPLAFLVVKSPLAPVASFTANVTAGKVPLTVQFNDTSTNFPTSWAWDFDNDGDVDSTDQNPSLEYAALGTYSVKLTATNAGGSDEELKMNYITVSDSSIPEGKPDFIVSAIIPNVGEIFANEANNISAKVENSGTAASGPFTVSFSVNGTSINVPVDGLLAGANTTLTITDPAIRSFGDSVEITVSTDSENNIIESNETNNALSLTKTVLYNGYRGKRWTDGNDISTEASFEGKYGLVYSAGNTTYNGASWTEKTYGWNSSDLPVPEGASVVSARLYQPYTYNKMDV
ncbi:MAG: DUF3344 domain-containing protein, partial [Methanosarcinaceae archaeon]|nr:DUF3344 domain-containing protein [Methanosarcinaceae archaeon]